MKIKAFLRDLSKMPHMTLAGSVGFDIFEYQNGKEIYTGTFMPPFDIKDEYEATIL